MRQGKTRLYTLARTVRHGPRPPSVCHRDRHAAEDAHRTYAAAPAGLATAGSPNNLADQARAARCAAAISAPDISVAISWRIPIALSLPLVAARLNHICADTRSKGREHPVAYIMPSSNRLSLLAFAAKRRFFILSSRSTLCLMEWQLHPSMLFLIVRCPPMCEACHIRPDFSRRQRL